LGATGATRREGIFFKKRKNCKVFQSILCHIGVVGDITQEEWEGLLQDMSGGTFFNPSTLRDHSILNRIDNRVDRGPKANRYFNTEDYMIERYFEAVGADETFLGYRAFQKFVNLFTQFGESTGTILY
jgi:hypothetical protein